MGAHARRARESLADQCTLLVSIIHALPRARKESVNCHLVEECVDIHLLVARCSVVEGPAVSDDVHSVWKRVFFRGYLQLPACVTQANNGTQDSAGDVHTDNVVMPAMFRTSTPCLVPLLAMLVMYHLFFAICFCGNCRAAMRVRQCACGNAQFHSRRGIMT